MIINPVEPPEPEEPPKPTPPEAAAELVLHTAQSQTLNLASNVVKELTTTRAGKRLLAEALTTAARTHTH